MTYILRFFDPQKRSMVELSSMRSRVPSLFLLNPQFAHARTQAYLDTRRTDRYRLERFNTSKWYR